MTVPSPLRSAISLKIAIGLLVLALSVAWLAFAGSRANAASTDLFFSEYVEGTSTNKALELYNGTASAISLDGVYTIQIFSNGSASATATIPLVGSIGASEAFVLARAGADADLLARANQTTSNFLFNGNDAIVLVRDGVTLDVIGQIGTDPGTAWESGGVRTLDQTLRRRGEIVGGDADGSDVFDPFTQWETFPIDTFGGLGVHSPDDLPNSAPIASPDTSQVSDAAVRIDPLANDSDPDGDPLTIVSVSTPTLGAATIVDGGLAIEYTPPLQAWTHDTFLYEISDPAGASATALIEILFLDEPAETDPCSLAPTLVGTSGRDLLVGTPSADVIHAGAGNDLVLGLGGDDVLCGGPGIDTLFGGRGSDIVIDTAGRTLVFGGRGDDQITTGDEADRVWAGAGDDVVKTGAGRDRVHGGRGADTLDAGPGRDLVDGGQGIDVCATELHDWVRRCP